MGRTLRIHRFLERSEANGPGVRFVVWTQGCSLGCPGCFNAQTHSIKGGQVVPVAELSRRIGRVDGIEGVSVLGGEPLQQRLAVMELLTLIRAETPLSIILWSGFTLEEISRMPEAERLFGLIDVLIAGRYEHEKRLARGLRGSTNKTVTFFSGRYTRADIDSVPECEIIFTEDGEVLVTGIDPIISTSE